MLIETRLDQIVSLVEQKGSVTVKELMDALQASESTIRRDLNTLDAEGRLTKVHGGALTREKGSPLAFTARDAEVKTREARNRGEKLAIARYAATLIQPNDFVFLDAGTSTGHMIDFISETRAVFVTNAIVHATRLAAAGFHVSIIGGQLKPITQAIVGEQTLAALKDLHFTKGFFGTNGADLAAGFTTPDLHEAAIKRKAFEQCRERFVLCDSSKFGQTAPVTFADIDLATVLTDRHPGGVFQTKTNIMEVHQ